ncbi:FAD-binding oxidoreductase [Sebaldella sp. S0638]|uniref:FAD-binding oxidoreductase n=1 Tax=Sebaldella sp. S0638 TaxID=2957809 RepID=UPI00209CB6D8|nr:FAD-binding oxidoreductase [Sebaldella sp. S0638]MCP1223623.1 FAD-binding oxidoreductase [Sebaldella sp. S0638]
MKKQLIFPMEEKYAEYLRDESRMAGVAESISFPENEEEILEVMSVMKENNTAITIQGGKTGITGCAVPAGGHIMNLSRLNNIKEYTETEDGALLRVEAGVTLMELKKSVRKLSNGRKLFWAPDPTEVTATVGGIAGCNAKGISAYLYGGAREHISAIRVIHSDQTIREIKRGSETVIFLGEQTDLIDVYLGGEGMYGVITELTLELLPQAKEIWGIGFFFYDKKDAFLFIGKFFEKDLDIDGSNIAVMEYLDKNTIDIIQKRKETVTKLKEIPDIDNNVEAMIYIEIHGNSEDSVEQTAEILMETAMEANSDPDNSWAVSGEAEIEKMRDFRHAAPESANLFIEEIRQKEPRITKLGTDMSLSSGHFGSIVENYEEDLKKSGLKGCVFGHIGGNHLHINILPENYEEYIKGRNLLRKWSEDIIEKNGEIAAEHGIGKLKRDFFLEIMPKTIIDKIRKEKDIYDPEGLWNPDNMI